MESIKHFVSKGAMDIEGLGEENVMTLFTEGHITDVADLYGLAARRYSIMWLPGWSSKKTIRRGGQEVALEVTGTKLMDKILAAVDQSRSQPFHRVLFALGIRHVGGVTAKAITAAFPSIDALLAADAEQLAAVPGIGPVVAEAVVQHLADGHNLETVTKLREAGLQMVEHGDAPAGGPAGGLTFVLTGKLPTLSRSEAQALIEAAGGRVTSSVSKATDYVLAGEDPGSKYAKAQRLEVPIISEADLRRLLAGDDSEGGRRDASTPGQLSLD